jgi:mannose-6-phosphate isomerase-like protein (cupin superfamily)
MAITRRGLCCLFPALLPAATRLPAFAVVDQSLRSAAFTFDKMQVQTLDHAEMRRITKGALATSEHVEVHEATLPPNGYPHAPHHHTHSEMWLIREGKVELTINGTAHILGPGDMGFVHSNEEHGIKNIGSMPATYFVVAIGRGSDTQP